MSSPCKALLHYRAGPALRAQAASLVSDTLQIVVVDDDDDERFSCEMRDTDVLLHVLKPVTRAVIEAAPRLKLIQKIGVGVNTIDLDAAHAAGVHVANMPGTNSQAVAEHALALLLAVLRRIPYLDHATRQGEGWTQAADELESVGEVAGRTVGLVGYGEVPRRLAPILRAMGAKVIFTDRRDIPSSEYRKLDDLLSEADVVSLHVPSTPETWHLISQSTLYKMKPSAILINTARGDLIDERALASALREGRLRGAGLDVLAEEPAIRSVLFDLPNVVLTPHIAWLTPETIDRSLSVALANIRHLQLGERLENEIQPRPASGSARGNDRQIPHPQGTPV